MNELRKLGQQGRIADFVEKPPLGLSVETVSGVSLKIDDLWLNWYNRQWWMSGNHPPHYPYGPMAPGFAQRELRMFFGATYDFSTRPGGWNDYCKRKGIPENSHPVSVVVILREPQRNGPPESWPREIERHPIVYEYRPEAFAHSVRGGDAVRGASTGTLGGYLENKNDGQHFAISCAHVFGHPLSSSGTIAVHATSGGLRGGQTLVGTVIESVFPTPVGGKCNRCIQPLPQFSNGVDAAVADLAGAPVIDLTQPYAGKVSQVTPIAQIGQSDPVTFTGATSGTVQARVKECNIWKELTVSGKQVCFGDLLVLEDVVFHYLASSLSKPGDSGSWVISTTGGVPSWDAMLIGGDGANSYCSYAENVMAALDPNLRIPP